ncbi:MAG: hypothetical protein GTO46_10970 [Gemmatimonadetes bacterium]|nr:hypothetical protein [Gemmatimonadota bacterium]NIO32124.1 hypothetical protein [Gemmatimonadota bacterium]
MWRLVSLSLLLVAGCGVYSLSGGGGLPGHIDSVAILPLDNRTTQFTLTQELTQALLDNIPGRLGLRPADEGSADSILRGEITRYDDRAVNYQPDPEGPVIFQRRVDITISIEIYDVREEQVLWSSRALSASGEYQPDQGQSETDGRFLAIDNLIQLIIDGAQSQW